MRFPVPEFEFLGSLHPVVGTSISQTKKTYNNIVLARKEITSWTERAHELELIYGVKIDYTVEELTTTSPKSKRVTFAHVVRVTGPSLHDRKERLNALQRQADAYERLENELETVENERRDLVQMREKDAAEKFVHSRVLINNIERLFAAKDAPPRTGRLDYVGHDATFVERLYTLKRYVEDLANEAMRQK